MRVVCVSEVDWEVYEVNGCVLIGECCVWAWCGGNRESTAAVVRTLSKGCRLWLTVGNHPAPRRTKARPPFFCGLTLPGMVCKEGPPWLFPLGDCNYTRSSQHIAAISERTFFMLPIPIHYFCSTVPCVFHIFDNFYNFHTSRRLVKKCRAPEVYRCCSHLRFIIKHMFLMPYDQIVVKFVVRQFFE